MKDDVRLFRIREDAVKDEFKSARDKPLTDEEKEQMWKNVIGIEIYFNFARTKRNLPPFTIQDCPPRGAFDPSKFEERHRARNAMMDEWRTRNAEMNEQVKQMEREVEEEDREDRERNVKETEQNIEEDKGRSTKNITVKITAKLSNALQMLN